MANSASGDSVVDRVVLVIAAFPEGVPIAGSSKPSVSPLWRYRQNFSVDETRTGKQSRFVREGPDKCHTGYPDDPGGDWLASKVRSS